MTLEEILDYVIGMDFKKAKAFLYDSGVNFRIVREDRNYFPLTREYKRNRINIEAEDGKVVKCYIK